MRVVGLVAAAENAVSGSAMRPGDVVRHYGGRTSEVTNTDAEGRLVMADALAYAVAELEPAAIVDVATLTGAMKVALGLRTGGFFADDEALAGHIAAAGEASGETLWRMPLADVYEDRIASEVADADNAGGGPGAITAALFLRHFTGDVPVGPPRRGLGRRLAGRRARVERRPDRLRRPRAAELAGLRGPAGRGRRRRGRLVKGLTVRWSLAEAPEGVEAELATYVEGTSHAKFTGMSGLRFKTWRMRAGEWFEGCYVFASDEARAAFQETFTAGAAEAPGSVIIGSAPVLIEACDVVAVAEGWDGFTPVARDEG